MTLCSSRKLIVVIALSVINGMNAITRITSLMFVASVERFDVDREKASYPYTLRNVVEPLAGPFAGYLAGKIGIRPVVVFGGFLASAAFATGFFANDILMITLIYGVIYAIGIAMAREVLPVVINEHFEEDIALINGLAFLGSSVGGLLLPPLFDFIYKTYGLSGAFLIMGGLLFHSVPAGMLLWAPRKKPTEKGQRVAHDCVPSSKRCEDSNHVSSVKTVEHSSSPPTDKIAERNKSISKTSANQHIHSNFVEQNMLFSVEATFSDKEFKTPKNCLTNVDDDDKIKNNRNANVHEQSTREHTNIECPFEIPSDSCNKRTLGCTNQDIKRATSSQVSTKDSNYQFILDSLKPRKWLKCFKCKSSNHIVQVRQKKNNVILSLFLDPLFILLSTSQSLYRAAYTVFLIILMDVAVDFDIPRHQSIYLVMCVSGSDILGRVGLGWITDKGYMGIVNYSALCFFITSVSMVVMCLWTSQFAVMFPAVFVFGLLSSGASTVLPGVVSKYFKGDQKTTAMGSRYFLYAPMSLPISPLIGFFRIRHGSYIGLMYLIAASFLLCAIFQLLHPILAKNKKTTVNAVNIVTFLRHPIERLI